MDLSRGKRINSKTSWKFWSSSLRCISWKIAPNAHAVLHEPGKCDRCWIPCKNAVKGKENGRRCSSCWNELTARCSTQEEIGLALLDEKIIPPAVFSKLAASDKLSVSLKASSLLDSERSKI